MDLYLLAAWIMFWDLIILGIGIIGAYQWHKKTMEGASRLHDDAIQAIPGLVWTSLNTPIADDPDHQTPMMNIRSSITASIDGKMGTYFRDLAPMIQQGADPQGAVMMKLLDIFSGKEAKKKK
jgi:hypothetical protein